MEEPRPLPPREPAGVHDLLPPGWAVDMLEEQDLDEVLAIETASFSNPWTRQMFQWEMENLGVSYGYVLRVPDRRTAAFCTVWIVLNEVHINNLAVHPDCRGRGLGRKLLEFVLALAAGLGARRATLEVRRSNVAALNLYKTLGFTVAGVRKNYYASPVEDALILWREAPGHRPAEEGRGVA